MVALGVLCALVGVLVYVVVGPSTGTTKSATTAAPTTTTTSAITSAAVYQAILPSLVLIQAEPAAGAAAGVQTIGSGVVINAAGQIMTAYHVVGDASNIQVTFADGTKSVAAITSSEPDNDIAVLQAAQAPSVIVPAVLGNDGNLRIGDEAFSAGNPLGLTASFAGGVISGLNRTIPLGSGAGQLHGVIQFDAAVNPGSSGGPLLNRLGQVIGIVTGLANPTDQNVFIGVGFAVPISTAGGAAHAPPQ